MKQTVQFILALATFTFAGCNNCKDNSMTAVNKTPAACDAACKAKNNSTDLTCKLTSGEMQKRKTTVLESLRKQVLEKKELTDGYAFRFSGTDTMFDELTEFIKTERACCDFFTFDLSVSGDQNEIWMQITGPEKAKEFIKAEMEL